MIGDFCDMFIERTKDFEEFRKDFHLSLFLALFLLLLGVNSFAHAEYGFGLLWFGVSAFNFVTWVLDPIIPPLDDSPDDS